MKYDFIFVVLVFRNTRDLEDFFESNHVPNSKVIVVNSFYDEESEKRFKEIAVSNNADYINVPNNGYGAGNNAGCKYALEHYEFKYLIISNADITIKSLTIGEVESHGACILAPKIITLDGRNQNPFWPYKIPKIEFDIKYWLNKRNYTKIIQIIYAFSKMRRMVFNVMYKVTRRRRIWAAHGAFVILEYTVLKKMFPLYNERMFLFAEEGHLCKKAESLDVKVFYVPEVVVLHKEDGSVGFVSDKVREMGRQSSMIFYETWFKK